MPFLSASAKRSAFTTLNKQSRPLGVVVCSHKDTKAQRGLDVGLSACSIKRGWCLGGNAFRQELLEQMEAGPAGCFANA